MSLTIGRLDLLSPAQVKAGRGSLDLAGVITHESAGSADAARDKARQLTELSGSMVPITWTGDPDVDGFYGIDSINVGTSNTRAGSALYQWAAKTIPIVRGTATIEQVLVGGSRSDEHGGSPDRWIAPPPAATGVRVGTYAEDSDTRFTKDGDIKVYKSIPDDPHPRYQIAPADWYGAAASITTDGVATEWTPGTVLDLDGTNHRLDNSIIQLLLHDGVYQTTYAHVSGGIHNAGGWGLAEGSGGVAVWSRAVVLRNDPSTVSVRLQQDESDLDFELYVEMDLTLHRGSQVVHAHPRYGGGSAFLGLVENGTDTGTDSGAGYVTKEADDPNGHRWTAGTAESYTTNDDADRIVQNPSTDLPAYFGIVVDGNTPTSADLYDQYLGTPSIRERILR